MIRPVCHHLATSILVLLFPATTFAQTLTPYEQYVREQRPAVVSPTATTVDSPSASGDPFQIPIISNQPLLAAGPQQLSGSEVTNKLKQKALGVVRGCDYAEYIELAQQVKAGWSMYQNWRDWNQVKRWAVPFMDLVSMFFRAGGVVAAKDAAEAEGEGLIYQLEQLCNAVVQADEINRQYQILAGGSLNMGNAIDWALDFVNMKLEERIRHRAEQRQAREGWVDLFDGVAPPMTPALDSLYRLMSDALRESLDVVSEIEAALDQIDKDLEQARKDLILKAAWKDNRWNCPEGYPDPNRPGVPHLDGYPVCGPVGPARSTEILAHLEVLKLSIRSLELRVHSRGLEVDAIGLMADNVDRRHRSFARSSGVLAN